MLILFFQLKPSARAQPEVYEFMFKSEKLLKNKYNRIQRRNPQKYNLKVFQSSLNSLRIF